ncbi:hypothetical protein [Methylosarcina fibrata]|uniref:hypothetical protein n=1 Tax=Methylosarcina fibrata TaxID=105972 RepID=UPI0012F95E13|nr:hypothetical protein [Methylosarcina fibrata]
MKKRAGIRTPSARPEFLTAAMPAKPCRRKQKSRLAFLLVLSKSGAFRFSYRKSMFLAFAGAVRAFKLADRRICSIMPAILRPAENQGD